jgi:membrane-associated protease RseP (regulator of RpoE activity)
MDDPLSPRAEADQADLSWILPLLSGVFDVDDTTEMSGRTRAIRLRGRFRIDTEEAYGRLASQVRARGCTLRFVPDGDGAAIVIVYGTVKPTPNNRWLPPLLAALTVLSVLVTSTLWSSGGDLAREGLGASLTKGAQFTVSLLTILLAHELGHYFMARHFNVAVTLPYLIPFPMSMFGTMGAVIRMKDIPPSRRALLMIGAAGPLAGLAVGIPILLLGIALSQVEALPAGGGYLMEGNSLLYAALKYIVHGRWLPSGGLDMMMHPVAFAGWAGLLVTSLNLLPAGQLDGGHAASALLGPRARYLSMALIGVLLLLGTIWQGWLMWAVLVFVFSRHDVPPLDAVSPLHPRDKLLAVLLLVLFVLTFAPVPMRTVP